MLDSMHVTNSKIYQLGVELELAIDTCVCGSAWLLAFFPVRIVKLVKVSRSGYPIEMVMVTYVADCKIRVVFMIYLLLFLFATAQFCFYNSCTIFSHTHAHTHTDTYNPQQSEHTLCRIFTFSCIREYIVLIFRTHFVRFISLLFLQLSF